MDANTADWNADHRGPGLGLTLVGLAGLLSAAMATLLMWMLLSSPAEVTTAAAEGVPELLRVVLSALYDAARPLLAWI
jgi:hypothetical protein